MVAAHKLYPEASICLGGAVNRNVREFQALYADLIPVVDPGDVERDSVRRLILVDTVHANRLGDLGDLCGREGVQIVAFDHHTHKGDLPDFIPPDNLVSSADGSLVTLLVRIVAERGIPITPFEATVFALGIHEDTGSLTFSTTTPADAEALALCMLRGADTALLEKWLANALTARAAPHAGRSARHGRGAPRRGGDGAPLGASPGPVRGGRERGGAPRHGPHRLRRLLPARGHGEPRLRHGAQPRRSPGRGQSAGRGGRRRPPGRRLGGRQGPSLDDVAAAVAAAVPAAIVPMRTVRDVLVPLPRRSSCRPASTTRRCAAAARGSVALSSRPLGDSSGKVALADLERAAAHGLGHAPVKAIMTSRVTVIAADATLEHAATRIAQEEIGWAPVVRDATVAQIAVDDLLGAATRRAVAGDVGAPEPPAPVVANLAGPLGELGLDSLLRHIQAVAAGVRGVYLVGGAVRDLLLGEPGFDVDIAVEGDGIALAGDLAERLKGHVRPHEKFGTAVVVAHDAAGGSRQRVDVASTRSESYAYPAALPKVEHAGIRSDLARRDFTINAMAVSLKPETYGDLLDYYGGMTDLAARRIVVLHNLSFIEDPTRVLRAIRYENRYGLRMDEHTLNLARACCAMDLVGDLSSARLRDELIALLEEESVDFSLRRMEELGLTPSIHGRLRAGAATRDLVRRGDAARAAHHLEGEIPRWRLRLVWMLRDLEPEEIAIWAERMRIRRHDAEVLERALVVGRRLVDRVARGPSEADLYEFAHDEPLEAVLVAMELDETGIAAERLGRFLDVTRHVKLAIGGGDLLELGFAASPEMGDVLRSVLHLKLNGVVRSRDEELAAAARLRG